MALNMLCSYAFGKNNIFNKYDANNTEIKKIHNHQFAHVPFKIIVVL